MDPHLPPDDLAAAAAEIARMISEYRSARDSAPVHPHPDPGSLRRSLHAPLPAEGSPLSDLLNEIRERIIPHGRRNDSPRFFGYVCSGGSDAGALADFLASGLNQCVTSWRSAPAAAELERLVVDWLRQIVGMPEGTEGLLLSGGSAANLTALAVARDALPGADISGGGLITLGRELTMYASEEVHMSIPRGASLLGIGREGVRILPTAPAFTIDLEALRQRVEEDRAEGRVPFCVVANAGSTGTGAIDPIPDLARFCAEQGLWLHVDAAYGGFGALSTKAREALAGMEAADSLTIDPHKWLHIPFDCGALLVRDAAALRLPFGEVGEYARSAEAGARASFTFFEQGPELSRRFRALKVWLVIRHHGIEALGRMVDHDIETARLLARRIEESDEMELLAPVPLSTVCFRYAPRGAAGADLDRLNRAILGAIQREAVVYPTHTVLKGRFALRACILNPRTGPEEVELLLNEVRRHGRALTSATSGPPPA